MYGPKLTWADFVMGRNDLEPISLLTPLLQYNSMPIVVLF